MKETQGKETHSVLLDNTFHHSRFADTKRLCSLKKEKGLRISLAFPTLNEEATIGKEILVIKTELMDRLPLIDEIAVIDSGSSDKTREISRAYGAQVYLSKDILKSQGTFRGKGENLWKSLYALSGDIIVWIDADIQNISPKFVYALIGPLLENDELQYVKAFYERPLKTLADIAPSGGGRVTEILVRPLFSLFYPELAFLIQPLSGEYAGRRKLLEQLAFSVGYGVELGHLLDVYHACGIGALAQVDIDKRIHRNQSVQSLSRMSFGILNTFFNRLRKYGDMDLKAVMNAHHIALNVLGEKHEPVFTDVCAVERPPIIEVSEYRKKFHPKKD
ncbi:MAG: glucosyl-3-phosphoglycerate synthase [Spirochaetales bacterium]|jgi:glucosyl-3-phosphoglycerate synthase|nr:glucosyl-3-phosphoglycerate synthase [Spirochaetales bacterium]